MASSTPGYKNMRRDFFFLTIVIILYGVLILNPHLSKEKQHGLRLDFVSAVRHPIGLESISIDAAEVFAERLDGRPDFQLPNLEA
jgi:hypothetical protein